MKLNLILPISAVYMALVGLAFLIVPATMQYGTLGGSPTAAALAVVRATAGLFFGIAVINWVAREAEPSTALTAVVLGNTIGFLAAAILLALAGLSGADSMIYIPTVINLVIAVLFFMAGRASMAPKKK